MLPLNYKKTPDWSFDKIASQFDTHIRRSIPSYDRGHEIIIKLLEHDISSSKERTDRTPPMPSSTHSSRFIIDLGSSSGTLTRKLARIIPDFSVLGIDIEPNMIAQSINSPELKNLKFKCADLLTEEFLPPDYLARAIIAYYTLCFIPQAQRNNAIAKIYSYLEVGGMFFWFEKIRLDSPNIAKAVKDLHYDFKRQCGFSELEIIEKERSLTEVLIPNDSHTNMNLVRNAGFREIEVIFRDFYFEGILAIK